MACGSSPDQNKKSLASHCKITKKSLHSVKATKKALNHSLQIASIKPNKRSKRGIRIIKARIFLSFISSPFAIALGIKIKAANPAQKAPQPFDFFLLIIYLYSLFIRAFSIFSNKSLFILHLPLKKYYQAYRNKLYYERIQTSFPTDRGVL